MGCLPRAENLDQRQGRLCQWQATGERQGSGLPEGLEYVLFSVSVGFEFR